MFAQRIVVVAALTFWSCALQAKEIALTEVVATTDQDGMQRVGSGRRVVDGKMQVEEYSSAMDELLRARGGASNACLVDATNHTDAIKASVRILAGYYSAETAVPAPDFKPVRGSHWFVVFLGCGHSGPRKWIVNSVAVEGKNIRLTYRKPKATFQTTDIVRYYYWVPLGKLESGPYDLELYDADLKAVTLMRRVEVR